MAFKTTFDHRRIKEILLLKFGQSLARQSLSFRLQTAFCSLRRFIFPQKLKKRRLKQVVLQPFRSRPNVIERLGDFLWFSIFNRAEIEKAVQPLLNLYRVVAFNTQCYHADESMNE